jgi:hypothetical protein
MPPLPDQVRHEFATLALGYYAAGRMAFHARAGALVSAHLLHHAVEFVLKATLARHTTLSDMKKFGHRLPDLYQSALARGPELRSDEHRATASFLHESWEMRFPDRILTATGHELDLAPIDRLFCAGIRATGLNPAAVTQRLGPDALEAIQAGNAERELFG